MQQRLIPSAFLIYLQPAQKRRVSLVLANLLQTRRGLSKSSALRIAQESAREASSVLSMLRHCGFDL